MVLRGIGAAASEFATNSAPVLPNTYTHAAARGEASDQSASRIQGLTR